MAIKNILVAFNGTDSSEAALHAAMLMHNKHGCHVTGLLVHAGAHEKLSTHSWVPQNVRQTISSTVVDLKQEYENRFREIIGNTISDDCLHWISLFGNADATVAKYARLYDLTLVGRYDAIQGLQHMELHPEGIALKSGRPVLVIPRGHTPDHITETAVIAWDGQRAVTRAVTDAMQLLETKQRVHIVSIEDGSVRAPLDGIDVATSLSRHGICVERVRLSPNKGCKKGVDILAYCDEIGAGMLVMGAYEKGVFRERLMGGTAHTVLSYANLPVLISH